MNEERGEEEGKKRENVLNLARWIYMCSVRNTWSSLSR